MTLFEKNLDMDMYQPGLFSGKGKNQSIPDTVDLTWLKPNQMVLNEPYAPERINVVNFAPIGVTHYLQLGDSTVSGIELVSEILITVDIDDITNEKKWNISAEVKRPNVPAYANISRYTSITTHARPGYIERDEVRDIILPDWLKKQVKIITAKRRNWLKKQVQVKVAP